MSDAAIKEFREFARLMSRARRAYDNASHTAGGVERRDSALSIMTAIENEFARCFVLRARPDWKAVEAVATGKAAA